MVCSAEYNTNESPDPDSGYRWLPTFNEDFLVQKYIRDKVFTNIRSVYFLEIHTFHPWCEKMPYFAMSKNPPRNSCIQIQIRTRMTSKTQLYHSSSLSTVTSLIKMFKHLISSLSQTSYTYSPFSNLVNVIPELGLLLLSAWNCITYARISILYPGCKTPPQE